MNRTNAGLFVSIVFFVSAVFIVAPIPFRSVPVPYQSLVAQVASSSLSDDVSVAGGFEDGVIAYKLLDVLNPLVKLNDFANRWSNTNGKNAPLLSLDTSDPRQGNYSLKVTLPGAPFGNAHDDRAEVVTVRDKNGKEVRETTSSGTKYYAISVKLDPSWQPPAFLPGRGQWGIFLQIHSPYSFSQLNDDEGGIQPSFALNATDRFYLNVRGGSVIDKINKAPSPYPGLVEMTKNDLALGHWVDFVVKIKFAIDDTGGVTVWRHDAGKTYFEKVADTQHRPTLYYNPNPEPNESKFGSGHVWRSGLYRDPQDSITNILWLDGFTRADSFAGAVSNAFPELMQDRIIDCSPAPECADDTPPVISLTGANPLVLTQGTVFTDPGARASDDVDGDITSKISASGSVDTATAGTYTRIYTVADNAGNSATKSRQVIINAITITADSDSNTSGDKNSNANVVGSISSDPTISIQTTQPITEPVTNTITFSITQHPAAITSTQFVQPSISSSSTSVPQVSSVDLKKTTVVAINYMLDGQLIHSSTAFPDTFSVDTTTLSNDFHTLLLTYEYMDGTTRDNISVFQVHNRIPFWKTLEQKIGNVIHYLKQVFSKQ